MGKRNWGHEENKQLLENYDKYTLDELAKQFPGVPKATLINRHSKLKSRNPYIKCNKKDCFAFDRAEENNCNCLEVIIEGSCPFYKKINQEVER